MHLKMSLLRLGFWIFAPKHLPMNGRRHRPQEVRRTGLRVMSMHTRINVCSGQVKTLAVSPNAHSALIGFTTGTVSVFDVRSGGILGTLKVPEGEVLKVRNMAS